MAMAPADTNPRVQKKNSCMNFVVDGESRLGSFKKRKSTLEKKASELAKLCDVMVCMVCLGPDGEVDTWPKNETQVRNRINKYLTIGEKGKQKVKQKYNLVGFMKNNKKKIERKLHKVKSTETFKENTGNMFSKWDEKLEQFSPEALMGLCNSLDSKLQNLRERIQLMQIMENEKATQVYNGDNNTITNPSYYMNMTNHGCQPLRPLMFNNEFCYKAGAIWPIEYYTVGDGSSSNVWWDGNVHYGKQQKFYYLGLNYNHNIPVGYISTNFSSGVAQADTGFRTQEDFGSTGESRGSIVLGSTEHSLYTPTSIHGVLPISTRR